MKKNEFVRCTTGQKPSYDEDSTLFEDGADDKTRTVFAEHHIKICRNAISDFCVVNADFWCEVISVDY